MTRRIIVHLAAAALLAAAAIAAPVAAQTAELAVGLGHCRGAAGTEMSISPWGLGYDAVGDALLIAEQKINQDVCIWSIGGAIRPFAGTGVSGYSGDGGDATLAQLQGPIDVVVDTSEAYISEGARIRVVQLARGAANGSGTITTAVGDSILWGPMGLALDHDDHLFVADCNQHRVVRFNVPCFGPGTCGPAVTVAGASGANGSSGDGGPATAARLNCPVDVAIAADGALLIADMNNNKIRRVSPSGVITTVAGGGFTTLPDVGDGGPATSARLQFPRGVFPSPDGGFDISDGTQNRVRHVTPAGVISTILGNGQLSTGVPPQPGGMNPLTLALTAPSGLQRDKRGALFVASDRQAAGAVVSLRNGAATPISTATATRLAATATAPPTLTATAPPSATWTVTRTPTSPPTATATATRRRTCIYSSPVPTAALNEPCDPS
ncbi:MAG: hypothetical protein ABI629_08845 [bacterium]